MRVRFSVHGWLADVAARTQCRMRLRLCAAGGCGWGLASAGMLCYVIDSPYYKQQQKKHASHNHHSSMPQAYLSGVETTADRLSASLLECLSVLSQRSSRLNNRATAVKSSWKHSNGEAASLNGKRSGSIWSICTSEMVLEGDLQCNERHVSVRYRRSGHGGTRWSTSASHRLCIDR